MEKFELLDPIAMQHTITRLCFELYERHFPFENTAIIGLQPRGVFLADRIANEIAKIGNPGNLKVGHLDVTFHRDDFRHRDTPLLASKTKMDFLVEGANVVLVDDVLYTGRTIRAGLDALLTFGRPKKVELLVLVDRRYSRDLPIQPDYVGRVVDTITSEKVKVSIQESDREDHVWLLTDKPQK